MEYTIISTIAVGQKNTRFLVQNSEGEYFSIKVPTGRYQIGDIASEAYYEPCLNEKWIKTANVQNGGYSRSKMMQHLIWYKQEYLHDKVDGLYQNSHYPHIFDSPEKNLVRGHGYDECLLRQMHSLGEELRSDFPHLTSSQAFAVNFFAPLIEESKLCLLDPCFDFPARDCSFEKVIPEEEQTQFDFFAADIDGRHFSSVEVKYSESGFGSTIGDTRHLDKYQNDYEEKMKELTKVPQGEWQFFEYYQVWRNLLYTIRNRGQHICFLFPRFREDLNITLKGIFAKCKDKYQPYFHIIIADDVVDNIIRGDFPMKPYYEAFKVKYLDIDQV